MANAARVPVCVARRAMGRGGCADSPCSCATHGVLVASTVLNSVALVSMMSAVGAPIWFYIVTPYKDGMRFDAGVDLWNVHGDGMNDPNCNEERCATVALDDFCDDKAVQAGTNRWHNVATQGGGSTVGVVQPGGYTKYSGTSYKYYCRGPGGIRPAGWPGGRGGYGGTRKSNLTWPNHQACEDACNNDTKCTSYDQSPRYSCFLHRPTSVWVTYWPNGGDDLGACWVKPGVASSVLKIDRSVNTGALDKFCAKARAGRGLGIIACVAGLVGAVTGCVTCGCRPPRLSWVALVHAAANGVATFFIFLCVAVFGSARQDFEGCCTARLNDRGNGLGEVEWHEGGTMWAAVLSVLLSAIGLGLSVWGWFRYKHVKDPAVESNVVESKVKTPVAVRAYCIDADRKQTKPDGRLGTWGQQVKWFS